MIKNFHQNIEQILAAATPEQKILWNYIFLQYGERISITQFYKSGQLTADVDLTTYVARKMFLVYHGGACSGSSGPKVPASGGLTLYNEANAIKAVLSNVAAYWDTTAANYKWLANSFEFHNQLFSRINWSDYEFGFMIGYKIVY